MKKQYETPNAKKVEFDYSENVVASNTPSKTRCECCKTYWKPVLVKYPIYFLGIRISICGWR